MNRGRDIPPTIDEFRRVARVHGHNGRTTEQATEIYAIAHFLIRRGDNTNRSRFIIYHTDCRFIR